MDTQQVLELLLTRMKTAQVKADADRVQMLDRLEANRKADQAKIEAGHKELLAKLCTNPAPFFLSFSFTLSFNPRELRLGRGGAIVSGSVAAFPCSLRWT
jgi:hypothetical protein